MTNPTSVRFNEKESLVHEWIKDFFGFRGLHGEDSQTIKQAELVTFNVLHNFFGDKLADIFKRKGREELQKMRASQSASIRKK